MRVLSKSATEFQTPALRPARSGLGLRRGVTPEPGTSRAIATDEAALSLNESRMRSNFCMVLADRPLVSDGSGLAVGDVVPLPLRDKRDDIACIILRCARGQR